MPIRRAVALLLAVVSVAALAGCKNAYRRELTVIFAPTATPAQHAAALKACTGVAPHSSPEPIVHSSYASSRAYDVRFRIDHASDRDLAKLQTCLGRQPGVVGTQDSADSG